MKGKKTRLVKPVQRAQLPCPNCHEFRMVHYTHRSFDQANRMWHWHYTQTDMPMCLCAFQYECTIPMGEDIRNPKAISWKECQ